MNKQSSINLRFISLNIQGDHHLNQVVNFFSQQKANVICLQEVFEADLALLAQAGDQKEIFFSPTVKINQENRYHLSPRGAFGIAILSDQQFISKANLYYVGNQDQIPVFIDGEPNSQNRVLAWVKVKAGQDDFTFATTHFTWSDQGQITSRQQADFIKLNQGLDQVGGCVLAGDFNTPRGGKLFDQLAQRYYDHIPQHINSTLDPQLHRVGEKVHLVVDGLFSTPEYQFSTVELIKGISDHQAIFAKVRKIS